MTLKLDTGTVLSGTTIDLDTLAAGSHTVTITAVDGLGNTTTSSVTFLLHPSQSGIGTAINEGVSRGLITSAEGTKLLGLRVNTANSVSTDLTNMLAEVKAQTGLAVNPAGATILTSWAPTTSPIASPTDCPRVTSRRRRS